MNYLIAILFIIAVTLIGLGLYWMFSPKYNTTGDYRALMPLAAGALFFLLALAVFGLTLLWRLWNNG
jgi:apolipoprotein N-acyltransferase